MKKLLVPLFLVLVVHTYISAQTSPCHTQEIFSKLDFWVGNWEVYTPQGQIAGHNKITKILDGCAIMEEWTGSSPSRGKSFNFYDPQSKNWKQVWIDNFANPLFFDGVVGQDSMTYTGQSLNQQGNTVWNEMILSKVNNDEVRQLWRQSTDEGATWATAFDGTYRRKN